MAPSKSNKPKKINKRAPISDDESGSDRPASKRNKRIPDPDLPAKTITVPQSEWLHPHLAEYENHIGSQGARDSAFQWVRRTLAGPFLDQFYPTLTVDQRKRFRPFAEGSMNAWLNNHSHRVNVKDPTDPKPRKTAVRNSENLWADDNKDFVTAEWTARCLADSSLISNAGARRSMICKMFGALKPEEKLPYQQKSQDLRREAQAKGAVADKDKEKFLDSFLRKLSTMFRQAEANCGIFAAANVALTLGGVVQIHQVSSPLGKKFMDSEAGESCGKLIEDWLGDNLGKLSNEGDPLPTVIPARHSDMRPLFPDTDKHQPTLQLARSMIRTAIQAEWQYHGGGGRVPYKTIMDAISRDDYSWIPKECLPEGAEFKESGYMTLGDTLIWIKHLSAWHRGGIPITSQFRFRQVYTIDSTSLPQYPEASSRVEVMRNNNTVCLATYDTRVVHPQNVKPIFYPVASWTYLYFKETGRSSNDICQKPAHWNGLDTRAEPDGVGKLLLEANEYDTISGIFTNSAPHIRALIADLVDVINRFERKLPVWTESGLWTKGEETLSTVPRVLPFVEPHAFDGEAYWANPWLDAEFFKAPGKVSEYSRLAYFETWQDEARSGGPSFHTKSSTHVGGRNGVVWIARGIIKVLANAGALIEDSGVQLKTPFPEGYDKYRVGRGDFEHAQQWAKEWTTLLEDEIAVLNKTYEERQQPAGFDTLDVVSGCAPQPVASGSRIEADLNLGADDTGSAVRRAKTPDVDVDMDQASDMDLDVDTDMFWASNQERACSEDVGSRKGKEKEAGTRTRKAMARTTKQAKANADANGTAAKTVPTPQPKSSLNNVSTGDPTENCAPNSSARSLVFLTAEEISDEVAHLKSRIIKEFAAKASESLDDHALVAYRRTVEADKKLCDAAVANWTMKQSAVGMPLEYPPVGPCESSPGEIGEEMEQARVEAQSKRIHWYKGEESWGLPYDEDLLRQMMRFAQLESTEFPHLQRALIQQSLFTVKSRHWFKEIVREDLQAIHSAFAIGSHVLIRRAQLIEAGQKLQCPHSVHDATRAEVFSLRQIFDQLMEFEKLARTWRNRFQDRFRWIRIAHPLEELVELAEGLQQWGQETDALRLKLERESVEVWRKAKLSKHHRPGVVYYTFGSPLKYGFDDDARAELVRARAELEHRASIESQPESPAISNTRPRPRMKVVPGDNITVVEQTEAPETAVDTRVEAVEDRVPAGGETEEDRVPADGETGEDRVPAGGETEEDRVPAGGETEEDRVPAGGETEEERAHAGGETEAGAQADGGCVGAVDSTLDLAVEAGVADEQLPAVGDMMEVDKVSATGVTTLEPIAPIASSEKEGEQLLLGEETIGKQFQISEGLACDIEDANAEIERTAEEGLDSATKDKEVPPAKAATKSKDNKGTARTTRRTSARTNDPTSAAAGAGRALRPRRAIAK